MRHSEDIFDRMMSLPLLRMFQPFYQKHKEVLLYLFFGALTTVVSIGSYAFFSLALGVNELIANLFSWILAVTFAFFTNRIWVFQAKTTSFSDFFRQLCSFFGGRLATLGVEEIILLVFITCLHFPGILVKTAAQIVVILLNYIISKLFVFQGTQSPSGVQEQEE